MCVSGKGERRRRRRRRRRKRKRSVELLFHHLLWHQKESGCSHSLGKSRLFPPPTNAFLCNPVVLPTVSESADVHYGPVMHE